MVFSSDNERYQHRKYIFPFTMEFFVTQILSHLVLVGLCPYLRGRFFSWWWRGGEGVAKGSRFSEKLRGLEYLRVSSKLLGFFRYFFSLQVLPWKFKYYLNIQLFQKYFQDTSKLKFQVLPISNFRYFPLFSWIL